MRPPNVMARPSPIRPRRMTRAEISAKVDKAIKAHEADLKKLEKIAADLEKERAQLAEVRAQRDRLSHDASVFKYRAERAEHGQHALRTELAIAVDKPEHARQAQAALDQLRSHLHAIFNALGMRAERKDGMITPDDLERLRDTARLRFESAAAEGRAEAKKIIAEANETVLARVNKATAIAMEDGFNEGKREAERRYYGPEGIAIVLNLDDNLKAAFWHELAEHVDDPMLADAMREYRPGTKKDYEPLGTRDL